MKTSTGSSLKAKVRKEPFPCCFIRMNFLP